MFRIAKWPITALLSIIFSLVQSCVMRKIAMEEGHCKFTMQYSSINHCGLCEMNYTVLYTCLAASKSLGVATCITTVEWQAYCHHQ